jgi:flagellar hook-length control protein FliK
MQMPIGEAAKAETKVAASAAFHSEDVDKNAVEGEAEAQPSGEAEAQPTNANKDKPEILNTSPESISAGGAEEAEIVISDQQASPELVDASPALKPAADDGVIELVAKVAQPTDAPLRMQGDSQAAAITANAATTTTSETPAVDVPAGAAATATGGTAVNAPANAIAIAQSALPATDLATTSQSARSQHAAKSAIEAAPAVKGDAEAPPSPPPATPQSPTPARPQIATPPEPTPPASEPAKPAMPAMEAGAPKATPVPLPDSPRAPAPPLHASGLQVAQSNDPLPLPLKAAAIAVEIVSKLREGIRRFDIRLDPPELGRVDVRLEMDRGGNVTTKLTVDRPETLELMQREARGLERALQQAGLKTDAGGLEFSLRQHAEQEAERHRAFQEVRPANFADEEEHPAPLIVDGYKAAAYARGGVDIRI